MFNKKKVTVNKKSLLSLYQTYIIRHATNIFLFIAAMLLGVIASAQSRIITTIVGQVLIGAYGTTVKGDSCGHIGIGGPAAHSLINGARFVCTDTSGNIYFSGPATGLKRIDRATGILTQVAVVAPIGVAMIPYPLQLWG